MATKRPSNFRSAQSQHPGCSCKNICNRKTKRGACPCLRRGMVCSTSCNCGTAKRGCTNKRGGRGSGYSSSRAAGRTMVDGDGETDQRSKPKVNVGSKMEAAQQSSWSCQLREQGNTIFRSAHEDLGFTIRSKRLDEALTCYINAMSCSGTNDESVSACKNIATTSWKLAVLHRQKNTDKNKLVFVRDHFKRAIQYYGKAYMKRGCKTVAWAEHLEESLRQCMYELLDWLTDLDIGERIGGTHEYIGFLPDCLLKAEGYIQLATLVFHEGITAAQNSRYRDSHRYMKECYFPIQEALRLCDYDEVIITEAGVLQEDVYLQLCVAESSMARATGDTLLDNLLTEKESVNIDMLWEIIDWYKQATVLCKDKDLEQEAIAYSRLGKVYGKVLKMSVRAKDCYKRAIELAITMAPRNFNNAEWFKESRKFVEDFQREMNKDEEDDKEKEAALKEMEKDVKKLKGLRWEGTREFVKGVYSNWPPKDSANKFNAELSDKKLLLRAISHYHPDKCDKEKHGKNWYYFCSEITKYLNEKYTTLKCPPDDD